MIQVQAGVMSRLGKVNVGFKSNKLCFQDAPPVDRALVVGYAFALQVNRLTGEIAPGRANLAIAKHLVDGPLLGMPMVLEQPLALAYGMTLRERGITQSSGPVLVVSDHRKLFTASKDNVPRISASEVAVQAAALLGTSALPAMPVVPVGVPQMMKRIHADSLTAMRNLPSLMVDQGSVLIVPPFHADARWHDRTDVPMHDGYWDNAHPWTAHGSFYKYFWDPIAFVRDQLELSRSGQQHHWTQSSASPDINQGSWGRAFESSLAVMKPLCEVPGLSDLQVPAIGNRQQQFDLDQVSLV